MQYDASLTTSRSSEDAIDAIIRHRFRCCETMPLFPEARPATPGFFESAGTGRQLLMFNRPEVRRTEQDSDEDARD